MKLKYGKGYIDVKCSCGNKTFFLVRDRLGLPLLKCTKCKKVKRYPAPFVDFEYDFKENKPLTNSLIL